MALRCLDLEAFGATRLTTEPFAYLVVPGFVRESARDGILADYPQITERGSFPASQLAYGARFAQLLDELNSDAFREAFEEKFDLALSGRPTTITVRGRCGPKDGKIHTDSLSKIITVLIYMNEVWEPSAGRLRLLRSPHDLNDVVAEIPPEAGTMLAFRVTANSWHGHASVSGPRRVVQLNWFESKVTVLREHALHRVSARVKRALSRFR